jgi:hypothetical protein
MKSVSNGTVPYSRPPRLRADHDATFLTASTSSRSRGGGRIANRRLVVKPLAWQLLFVFGAWCALGEERRFARPRTCERDTGEAIGVRVQMAASEHRQTHELSQGPAGLSILRRATSWPRSPASAANRANPPERPATPTTSSTTTRTSAQARAMFDRCEVVFDGAKEFERKRPSRA